MKYYTTTTEYNCGIDLHARQMYACVMDRQGKVLLHCNIEGNDFDYFLKRVAPWRHDLTVVCECTFNWYWLADACDAAAVICKRAHRLITPHAEKLVSKHGTFKGNAILANQIARAGRTTTFHRDILGRVTNQVDNANKSVSYVYDQAGRMTRLIDQGGTPTIWDYDQEGRPTAKIYADGSTNSYTYNALSQLTAKTDAMGRHTHYRYDAVGNLTNIQYQTDAPASFTYDNLNRVVTMLDGVGATEYTYATDCGAVATVTGPFGDVVSYGYDPGKRLTNVMFRGDSRGYTLDPLDRIAAVSALGAEHEYTYLGTTRRLAQLARPNDTLTDYHYDGLGRLTNLVHREPGGGVLSSFGYALDNADQRTQVRREDGFQIDYDYDPVGQLVAAEGSEPGWQFGYQYDERGNPLRREHSGFVHSNSFNTLNQQAESLWSGGAVVLGAVNTTNAIIEINSQPAFAWGLEGMLVFGATNLAVQAGSNEFVAVVSDIFGRSDTNAVTVNVQDQAFAYDLNGNLTNDGVRAYSWDEADRLIEVRDLQTSDVLVQNRYDGLSRRRERIQLEDGILVTK
ncbi:MAG: hypothetical protein M9935_11470, partial [Kiritimatiellae bacterium]|nr:hypothetical protein [Kiritimatiellia bacterium]